MKTNNENDLRASIDPIYEQVDTNKQNSQEALRLVKNQKILKKVQRIYESFGAVGDEVFQC